MAQIMSEVLGKPVRFQQIPGKALKDRLTGFGMSEAMAQGTVDMAGFGVWGTLHGSLEAPAQSAAVELSPIRVNVVSPGGIGIRTDRQLVPHRGEPDDGGERLGTYPTPDNAWTAP
jgi:NAD(P)-dependent dehydrogenase (short-subunit alcohol dehydrogenase family)